MNARITENHKLFLGLLGESWETVWLVARWAWGLGYTVTVPAVSMAPTAKVWADHVDDGDLIISGNGLRSERIEVKRLSVNFSSRRDWPFGSKFIVCAKHSFDSYDRKPLMYVIVSADGRAVATVKTSTSHRWRVERRRDSRYRKRYEQDFYMADMRDVDFHVVRLEG